MVWSFSVLTAISGLHKLFFFFFFARAVHKNNEFVSQVILEKCYLHIIQIRPFQQNQLLHSF